MKRKIGLEASRKIALIACACVIAATFLTERALSAEEFQSQDGVSVQGKKTRKESPDQRIRKDLDRSHQNEVRRSSEAKIAGRTDALNRPIAPSLTQRSKKVNSGHPSEGDPN